MLDILGWRSISPMINGTYVFTVVTPNLWWSEDDCVMRVKLFALFSRAAITLGIGPHSSCLLNCRRRTTI